MSNAPNVRTWFFENDTLLQHFLASGILLLQQTTNQPNKQTNNWSLYLHCCWKNQSIHSRSPQIGCKIVAPKFDFIDKIQLEKEGLTSNCLSFVGLVLHQSSHRSLAFEEKIISLYLSSGVWWRPCFIPISKCQKQERLWWRTPLGPHIHFPVAVIIINNKVERQKVPLAAEPCRKTKTMGTVPWHIQPDLQFNRVHRLERVPTLVVALQVSWESWTCKTARNWSKRRVFLRRNNSEQNEDCLLLPQSRSHPRWIIRPMANHICKERNCCKRLLGKWSSYTDWIVRVLTCIPVSTMIVVPSFCEFRSFWPFVASFRPFSRQPTITWWWWLLY